MAIVFTSWEDCDTQGNPLVWTEDGMANYGLVESLEALRQALKEREKVSDRWYEEGIFKAEITHATGAPSSANWYSIFQNHITQAIPYFVNHTDNNGNWDSMQSDIPCWTESDILSEIGASQRIPAPAVNEGVGADWVIQQYKILNLLRWRKKRIYDATRKTRWVDHKHGWQDDVEHYYYVNGHSDEKVHLDTIPLNSTYDTFFSYLDSWPAGIWQNDNAFVDEIKLYNNVSYNHGTYNSSYAAQNRSEMTRWWENGYDYDAAVDYYRLAQYTTQYSYVNGGEWINKTCSYWRFEETVDMDGNVTVTDISVNANNNLLQQDINVGAGNQTNLETAVLSSQDLLYPSPMDPTWVIGDLDPPVRENQYAIIPNSTIVFKFDIPGGFTFYD